MARRAHARTLEIARVCGRAHTLHARTGTQATATPVAECANLRVFHGVLKDKNLFGEFIHFYFFVK